MSKSEPDISKIDEVPFNSSKLINKFLLFIGKFLSHKGDFPHQFTRVEQIIGKCIYCESVKISALVGREKLAFEH